MDNRCRGVEMGLQMVLEEWSYDTTKHNKASHPALGYKHWQGHRQRSNREKERRVLLKGFPPLCGGGIQKGTSDDYGAIYYDTVNTHNGHNGHGKNLAWEHNFN